MAHHRGSLAELAEDQALGIHQPPAGAPRFIEGPGIYDNGVVEEVRVRGYYPPTRKFYNATDRVESLSWTRSVEQAALQCTIVFDDTDGEATAVLNRLGMIWFVETRAPGGHFRERFRVIAWTADLTDDNEVEITAYDALLYLQIAKGHSFLYRADKDHPKGWTAWEIAVDIIKRFKIPVAYTKKVTRQKGKTRRKDGNVKRTKGQKAKTTGRMKICRTEFVIPYLHERNVSLYEMLAAPYAVDRKHTKRHYYMVSERGRLAIIRKPSEKRILAITANQIREFGFTRDLTESFASVLLPLGADRSRKNGKVKRKSRTREQHPRERQNNQSKKAAAREQHRAKHLKQIEADKEAALIFLFGALPSGKKLKNIRSQAAFYDEAKKTIDALARSQKTISVTCEGNVMVQEGDRVQVRIPVSDTQTLKRDLFVKTVTHTMAPGDYSMELELAWREKDVDLSVEVPPEALHRAKQSSGKGEEGSHGSPTGQVVTGKVSYFSGPQTAGGKDANTDPGIALNLHPGTEAGWDNETTNGWMAKSAAGNPVYARVEIAGHTAVLPIIDKGPAASTDRAIDVTIPGVQKLGFTTSNFPTDATGTAHILG